MRFTRSRLVGAAVAIVMTAGLPAVAATSAQAAKPAPPASCQNGDTTVTVKFDRSGTPLNTDPSVTVTGTSSAGTITADPSVLVAGYVRKSGRVNDFVSLTDPASESSYDNVGLVSKRGKTLQLTSIDVCTTANTSTPPETRPSGIYFEPDTEVAGATLITYRMEAFVDRDTTFYGSVSIPPSDFYELQEFVIPAGLWGENYFHPMPGDHVTGSLYVDGTAPENLIESFDCTIGVDCPTS